MFKNVVIFSLDCVRREALGCYPQRFPWRARVMSKAATPVIDELCRGGIRFDQAITHAPFTPAAHASLFTGLIPPKHEIRKFLGDRLDEKAITLAELLSAAGWQCGAVVSAYSLHGEYGFARGFQHYAGMNEEELDHKVQRSADEVTERALSWLNGLDRDRPFFLFVHYFDAHNVPRASLSARAKSGSSPDRSNPMKKFRHTVRDTLPGPLSSALQWLDGSLRGIYYKGVKISQSTSNRILGFFEAGRDYKHEGRRFMLERTAEIDAQIGRITQLLSEKDKLDETLIILLADHGDDFWEHGEPTHRRFLYDTTILVPLIIYPEIGNRSIVSDQVRLVDIVPTVLSIFGLEPPVRIDGENLLPLMEKFDHRKGSNDQREAYAETLYEVKDNETSAGKIETCYACLREYPWKLIWNRLDGSYELYRVDLDPNESKNLVEDHPQIVDKLSAELQQLAQEMPVEIEEVDERMVERLKALGYL
jgi:arylsulfatase A-like enzyme